MAAAVSWWAILELDFVEGQPDHVNVTGETQVDHAVLLDGDRHGTKTRVRGCGLDGDLEFIGRLNHVARHRHLVELRGPVPDR